MGHSNHFHLPFTDPVIIFAIVLIIMLIIPLLLKRLKIPGIIGLILSGIVIGPNGFNLIEKSSAIELLSTIGLLYIMFLAGLELDLQEFKKRRYRSILFGAFTFIIPIIIGIPVCFYLLKFGFLTSFLTSIMFATHTLIAYPIVSRMGLADEEAVAITVGGTIITDTAVLVLLSLTTSISSSSIDTLTVLKTIAALLVFMSFILFLVPRLTRWFLRTHQGDQGAHFLFVLLVVFLLAFLAELGGVEPIIGAFAAGLVLNPYIPHKSILFNRITFTGNVIFIPFFLIGVGMLVDPRILFRGYEAIEVAFVLTVVAFAGKWAAAYLTQKVFKYSILQRNLIFGLSSSHAAATLAIILVGYNLRILNENILNGTIILILITCLVATLVTEKTSIKLKQNEANFPAKEDKQFEKIIVPVSNPQNIESLIDLAVHLKTTSNPNPITILTVVKDDSDSHNQILINRRKIKPILDYATSMDTTLELTTAIDVNAVSGIIRSSREKMATMMVLGWKNQGKLKQKLFGHFYERLINNYNGQLFIANIIKPLALHSSLLMIAPPLFRRESGSGEALQRIVKLAKGLKMATFVAGEHAELNALSTFIGNQKISWNFNYQPIHFNDKNFLNHIEINNFDLIVVFSSREYSPSYNVHIQKIPNYLDELNYAGSVLFCYPHQKEMVTQSVI